MLRNRYCIANWKMNYSLFQAKEFFIKWINKELNNPHIKTIFCPSFTELFFISEILKDSPCELGAQNVFYESKGAFTGEISTNMLREAGCKWVIVGHSERRSIMNETDDVINQKLLRVISSNLNPILCIGENMIERNDGKTKKVLRKQLKDAFSNIDRLDLDAIIIAYEPVWAIGTGMSATGEMIEEAHSEIRAIVSDEGLDGASISILYGGSVSERNVDFLSDIRGLDGFLIGSASLDVDRFYSIYNKL